MIRKLQNDFTTPEQSKRLLELGVPAWTADYYYYEEGGISKDCTPNIVPLGEVWTDESKETMFSSYVDIPCWSVGRLMEIIRICNLTSETIWVYIERDNISTMISATITAITDGVNNRMLDFSKLEE